MIALDTNLLFHAFAKDRPEHQAAWDYLSELSGSNKVMLCELVLVELYRLLRNPTLLATPLSARQAVEIIEQWRRHPKWTVVGFAPDSARLHTDLWKIASSPNFAYRKIFDARLALTLLQHGATEFATANPKDFQGFGFLRVINPLQD